MARPGLWRNKATGDQIPVLRYYTVFNAATQCEGIKVPETPAPTFTPIEGAERIVSGLPDTAAPIRHGVSGACYVPDLDEVRMPSREAFHTAEGYYASLFHELTHSTGHESRLKRRGVVERTRFASHDYSEEELVADMGASFLGHEAGILPATIDNAAAYLRSWVKALRGDARLVVRAAGAAQKAADWLTNRQAQNGEQVEAAT